MINPMYINPMYFLVKMVDLFYKYNGIPKHILSDHCVTCQIAWPEIDQYNVFK